MLARPDGDEFLALFPGVRAEALALTADRIARTLAEPIEIDGGTCVFITASVGFALSPHDGDTVDDLARRVELALAKAKEGGGDAAVGVRAGDGSGAFAPPRAGKRLARGGRARRNRGRLPADHGSDRKPGDCGRGARTLQRPAVGAHFPQHLHSPRRGAGTIPAIGEFVLHRALADGLAWPGVGVSVNVSAAQIHHGDVVSVVRDALSAARFPPERLEIEITESVLLVDEKRADEQIKGLQRLGVKVALDDFGSGYSSLLYLRKFGFDKLKIDRSFIEEIGNSQDGTTILASIILLGLDLSLTITAEGIETPEQQRWLMAAGCHQLQGYLFSRPLAAEQTTAFIAAHRPAAAATG